MNVSSGTGLPGLSRINGRLTVVVVVVVDKQWHYLPVSVQMFVVPVPVSVNVYICKGCWFQRLFESTDSHTVVNFINETHLYHQL